MAETTFSVGARIEARYQASSVSKINVSRTKWHPGTVKAYSKRAKTYNISYDDGDEETNVLAQFVRAAREADGEAPPAPASAAAAAKRKGRAFALPGTAEGAGGMIPGARAGKKARAAPEKADADDDDPMGAGDAAEDPEDDDYVGGAPKKRAKGKERAKPDSEADAAPKKRGRPAGGAKKQKARGGAASSSAAVDDDDDDDDDAAEAGGAAAAGGVRKTAALDDDDDEVSYAGHRGSLALVDFPHSRENCALHPFVKGKEEATCENCYCYVCDAPASTCTEWKAHCKATHTDGHWAALRAQKQAERNGGAAAAPAAASGDGSSSSKPVVVGHARRVAVKRWSCDEILKAAEQVYPVEVAEPAGLVEGTVLRPYQKQSLAFMLDVEKSTAADKVGRNSHGAAVRGGWLADEVGMGKTMVVTTLVLASEPKDLKPVSADALRKWRRCPELYGTNEYAAMPIMEVKATLVIVNNTLVRQWKDELTKFAPKLKVHTFYATRENKERCLNGLREADVIITTPHMVGLSRDLGLSNAHLAKVKFRRLVVDESHLLAGGAEGSSASKLGSLCQVNASNVWLVSGTPFSTSLRQLVNQVKLLGCDSEYSDATTYYSSNEAVVSWLKGRMIRHTKNQRIGGEVALALPDADCQTKWLTMSDDERLLYGVHECSGGHTLKLDDTARFRAAAHLYAKDIVCGEQKWENDMARDNMAESKQITRPTMEDPSKDGKFIQATAAYGRAHTTVEHIERKEYVSVHGTPVPPGTANAYWHGRWVTLKASESADQFKAADQRTVTEQKPGKSMTKFARLLADLKELREKEPDFRAVVFTKFDEVQKALVDLLADEKKAGGCLHDKEAPPLKVFQFNKHTPATSRHNKIHEFQHGKASGAYVFVVTVQTAAVGITLTAATRVYLMEPLSDPAAEVQAAGRIHRLGQSKDIFITRYAFKDSIEEATAALHERIKQGEIVVRDGQFPTAAYDLFVRYGPAAGLFQQHGEARAKVVHGEGLIDWEGKKHPPRPAKKGEKVVSRPSTWTRRCTEEECTMCGVRRLMPRSSIWTAPASSATSTPTAGRTTRGPTRRRSRRGAARSRRCRSRPTSGCPSASAASRRSRG